MGGGLFALSGFFNLALDVVTPGVEDSLAHLHAVAPQLDVRLVRSGEKHDLIHSLLALYLLVAKRFPVLWDWDKRICLTQANCLQLAFIHAITNHTHKQAGI